MKMLIGKKFKVEIWEKYLRTMKKNERARFHSSEKEDCLQYVSVSKMLRDIRDGKKVNNVLRIQCWPKRNVLGTWLYGRLGWTWSFSRTQR